MSSWGSGSGQGCSRVIAPYIFAPILSIALVAMWRRNVYGRKYK